MSGPVIHNDDLVISAMAAAMTLCILFGANAVAIKVSLIGLGLLVWALVRVRRSPFTLAQTAVYVLLYLIVRILWRARIGGRLPIPPGQGAVVICNHRCPLDSFSMALTA